MKPTTSTTQLLRNAGLSALLLCAAQTASAAFLVYVGAPSVMTSTLPSVTTEGFESFTPVDNTWADGGYNSAGIGTYTHTGGSSILPGADFWSANDGNYLGVGLGQTVTLTLDDTTSEYFGFAWTAGDGENQIIFQSGVSDVFTLNTQDIVDFLPNDASTITAIDTSVYNTADYYGQPGTGQNLPESYAYIHVITTGGDTFDKIVMTQTSGTKIFESDNHSVHTTPSTQGDWALVTTVPEPSTYALFAGILTLGWVIRSRATRK